MEELTQTAAQRARFSSQPCTTHRRHEPAPTYTELHHVIPQAWQAFWTPALPWPDGGPSPDRRTLAGKALELFDARTVPLCRTGHGNVHTWIVRMTRLYAELRATTRPDGDIAVGELEHEVKHRARAAGEHVGTADFVVAALALERWTAAGGSIDRLVRAGLWGEI